MTFELHHHFDAPIDTVAAAILNPAYQESLDQIGPLKSRRVLAQEEREGLVVRRVRCVLDATFSGPVGKIVGNSDPAWIEESTWHPEHMEWKWKIIPEVAANLISASGVMALQAAGQSTDRIVSGKVDVHVPFIGGGIAHAIEQRVSDVYDEEAERLARWISTSET